MSIAELPTKMTAADLLSMPDDGVERWLIHGELRENRDNDMNRRKPDHARTCTNIAMFLKSWVRLQSHPRGGVYTGDGIFKLTPDSTSVVGIDIAYISPELESKTKKGAALIDGPPVVAAEVLSPSEKIEDIAEKIHAYLDAGVAHVWIADPNFDMVVVHRPNCEPAAFNRQQELTAEPDLPGFRVRVSELFE